MRRNQPIGSMLLLALLTGGCAGIPEPSMHEEFKSAPAPSMRKSERLEEGGIGGTGRTDCSRQESDSGRCPEKRP